MTTISKMAMECSIQINNEISDFITETVNEALGKKEITINAKKIAEAIQKQTPKEPDDVSTLNDTLCKNYKIGFAEAVKLLSTTQKTTAANAGRQFYGRNRNANRNQNQHNSRLHHGVSLRQRNKKRTSRLYAGT